MGTELVDAVFSPTCAVPKKSAAQYQNGPRPHWFAQIIRLCGRSASKELQLFDETAQALNRRA